MRKWLLTGLILAALIILASTVRLWLTPFLSFAVTNNDLLQSIASLTQLVIWVGVVIVFLVRLWTARKTNPPVNPPPRREEGTTPQPACDPTGNGNIVVKGDASDSTIITGDDNYVVEIKEVSIVASPEPIATSLHQLPPPSADFTDRMNETAELREQLESGVRIYVVHGMGGVGKSDFAKKFAEQHLLALYCDAQFYLDLKGTKQPPVSVSEAMRHVIRSYHPTAKLPDSEAALSGMYRTVLYGQQALLLWDNASGIEQVEPLLPPSGCAMIITSRQSFTLSGMHFMTLKTLAPDDARALLLKIAPRIGDQADTLAALCGYLPFALRLAASAIAERPDILVAEYVQKLGNTQRLELVEASFSLSYEHLNPEQQTRLRALAVFPETFDAGAAAAVWNEPTDKAREVLSNFYKFSLIEWHETASRYQLHNLVRVFADAHVNEAERSISQRRYAMYYLIVWEAAGALYEVSDDNSKKAAVSLLDLEWVNIHAAQSWVEGHIEEEPVAVAACDSYTYSGASLLAFKRSPRERINWHGAVLAAARRLNRRKVECGNLIFMGVAYRDSGQFDKTIEHCQQALLIAREIPSLREESAALVYTGIAYYYKGNYEKAIDNCQQALDITRQTKDQHAEIEQLRYLGHAHRGLGQYEDALKYYRESLEIGDQMKDVGGQNYALGGLGRIYCDMGRHEEAKDKFLPQALKLARQAGDRRGEGFNLAHLGLAHRDLGLYPEARDYYEQALEIARELGLRSIEAYCRGGLGKIELAQSNFPMALEHGTAALNISSDIGMIRGQQYWGTLLAQIYLYQGRFDEASEAIKDALSSFSEWGAYRTFALHGLILSKTGQVKAATEAFQQAVVQAEGLLQNTPAYYDARYILGLSNYGLALTTTSNQSSLADRAQVVFRDAYHNCKSRGVIDEALRLIDELPDQDVAGELTAVRDYLRQLTAHEGSVL